MPLTYHIDPLARIIEVRGAGVITQAEYVDGLMSWMIDPLFRPGLDGLCDFTAAESTPTMADLRELVDLVVRHTAYVGRVKVAIIASKPITFGVAREFVSLAEAAHFEVQLFGIVTPRCPGFVRRVKPRKGRELASRPWKRASPRSSSGPNSSA
jgi:hypothetical protein